MILQILIAMVASWINRHQQQVIAYILEENHTLRAKLGDRRIRFTHAERCRLAALAFPLGRMIFIGERSLRHAIHHYLTHYHSERNHQGLDNQLISPSRKSVYPQARCNGENALAAC